MSICHKIYFGIQFVNGRSQNQINYDKTNEKTRQQFYGTRQFI